MASSTMRLPSHFPVGTKLVIEGRGGGDGQLRVSSRYLEFPDGTFFPLPAKAVTRKPRAAKRRNVRARRRHN